MNHASGTVAPLDPEPIQVGDAIGQRAQQRRTTRRASISRAPGVWGARSLPSL
jgi:hypothetical protein